MAQKLLRLQRIRVQFPEHTWWPIAVCNSVPRALTSSSDLGRHLVFTWYTYKYSGKAFHTHQSKIFFFINTPANLEHPRKRKRERKLLQKALLLKVTYYSYFICLLSKHVIQKNNWDHKFQKGCFKTIFHLATDILCYLMAIMPRGANHEHTHTHTTAVLLLNIYWTVWICLLTSNS